MVKVEKLNISFEAILLRISKNILNFELRDRFRSKKHGINFLKNIQFFFRFWSVNVKVPWTFFTIRSKALLRPDSNVLRRSRSFSVTTDHRSWAFLNVSWAFSTVCDLLRSKKLRNGHETFRNGQGRWTFSIVHKMSRTFRDVGQSETFILYKMNKSETYSKSRSLSHFKNEIVSVSYLSL